MFSFLYRGKRTSQESETVAEKKPLGKRAFSAIKRTGRNVVNNIEYVAERPKEKAAPAGFKFQKSFKNSYEAQEAAEKYESRGFFTQILNAHDGYGNPISVLYIKEKSHSTRKAETKQNLKGFTKRDVYNGSLWERAAMAKAKKYAEDGYEVKIGRRQGKIIVYTKQRKVAKLKLLPALSKIKIINGEKFKRDGTFGTDRAAAQAFAKRLGTPKFQGDFKFKTKVVKGSTAGENVFAVYSKRVSERQVTAKAAAHKKKLKRSSWYEG